MGIPQESRSPTLYWQHCTLVWIWTNVTKRDTKKRLNPGLLRLAILVLITPHVQTWIFLDLRADRMSRGKGKGRHAIGQNVPTASFDSDMTKFPQNVNLPQCPLPPNPTIEHFKILIVPYDLSNWASNYFSLIKNPSQILVLFKYMNNFFFKKMA